MSSKAKIISGIQKSSFIDYPGEVSFVIFLGGCNFRCPYCHNKSIVLKETNTYDTKEVLAMLKERQKVIKAVVISGGEPTIWQDKLITLIEDIKALGFKIKLDTNGTNPALLKKIIKAKLVDYIAMDIKNSFPKYELTCGQRVDLEAIKESIKLIESEKVPYHFRTTINKTMHTKEDLELIKSYVKYPEKLIFQEYKFSNNQLVDQDFDKY